MQSILIRTREEQFKKVPGKEKIPGDGSVVTKKDTRGRFPGIFLLKNRQKIGIKQIKTSYRQFIPIMSED